MATALTEDEIQEMIAEYQLRLAYFVSDEDLESDKLIAYKSGARACQYFIPNMPSICKYWNGSRCTFKDEDDEGEVPKDDKGIPITPSYYGVRGECDGLGRAFKCSHYESGSENAYESDFICIVPNFRMSGVGKRQVIDGIEYKTSVSGSEITGYNEIDGAGRCDGKGWGTGECGYNGDPAECRVVCNYYRPWNMGFGHLEPQSIESVIRGDPPPQAFNRRLPYNFNIYNLRSKMQKCLYWDGDPGQFYIEDDKIKLDLDPEATCSNQDVRARNYLISLSTLSGSAPNWMLNEVWTDSNNCVICNGAKPECPFYTGQWRYNIDSKMHDGMQITAEQILELRYWMRDWASQQEYESAFSDTRPNKTDPSSSSIFTWERWEKLTSSVNDSVGMGKEVWLDFGDKERAVVKKSEDVDGDKIVFIGSAESGAEIYLINLTGTEYYPKLIFENADLPTIFSAKLTIEYPQGPVVESREFKDEYIQYREVKYGKPAQEIGTRVSQGDQPIQVSFPSLIRDISNIYDSNERLRKEFGIKMMNFIKWAQEYKSNYISSSTAEEDGYFNTGSVDLNYQSYNSMLILTRTDSGEWNYYFTSIWSQWYGGVVKQSLFEHELPSGEDAIQRDTLPEYFSGTTNSLVALNPITGSNNEGCYTDIGDITPVYSKTSVDGLTFMPIYIYGYSLKKVTIENAEQNSWTKIGNTRKILVEINDINLNHLYEWDVIEAKMIPIDEEGNEIEENNVREEVEMEVVYPSGFSAGNGVIKPKTDQRYIKPNMVVLKPKDESVRFGFNNKYWKLETSYYYTKIENDNEEEDLVEVVWPNIDDKINFFGQNSYQVSVYEDMVSVDNISRQNVGLLVNFTDEEGRLMSPLATRLNVLVSKLYCRNIDILYCYRSPATGYKLMPDGGLATKIEADQILEGWNPESSHVMKPACGDHEMANLDYGFEWYPFNGCTTLQYYTEYASAGYCLAPYGEISHSRDDYRFCGPIKYDPWVSANPGWAADCKTSFKYRYSMCQDTPDGVYFCGKGYIRAKVDLDYYRGHDPAWAPPPFGNKGREMIQTFISNEYMGHMSLQNADKPYLKQQWMPYVIDNSTFFYGFNSFYDSTTRDCFISFNPLNMLINNEIGEEYTGERYRWEDVFGIRTMIYASYPEPLITYGDLLSAQVKAVFYYFKEDDVVWAWPEKYKDIQRSSIKKFGEENKYGNLIAFVDLEKPEYLWGYDKLENRYICDEGRHTIVFTPPEIEEKDDGDIEITTHASISLDEAHPRYFNILYSNYNSSSRVDWIEDGDDSSAGPDNIYYKTATSGDWHNQDNMIYDSDAVDDSDLAISSGRAYTSPSEANADIKYGYNRGIIANIYKNKLKYLPFQEELFIADEGVYSPIPVPYKFVSGSTWSGTSAKLTIEMLETPACITKVTIKGIWGEFIDGSLFCKPGFTIKRGTDEISEFEYSYDFPSSNNQDFVQYEISIPLNVNPDRMLKPSEKKKDLIVEIYGSENQMMNVSEIIFYKGIYAKWSEEIFTWERKFMISRAQNFEDFTPNGPTRYLTFDFDYDNSGVYINTLGKEEPFACQDKLRALSADMQYYEDIPQNLTMDNLMDFEQEAQRDLYLNAYDLFEGGGSYTYSAEIPPVFKSFFNSIGINVLSLSNSKFQGGVPEWEKHELTKRYKEGEFWQPQGHKFVWSPNYRRQKCRMGQINAWIGATGPVENVFEADFVHMDTYVSSVADNPYYALYGNRIAFQLQAADLARGTEAEKDPTGVLSTPTTPNYGGETIE